MTQEHRTPEQRRRKAEALRRRMGELAIRDEQIMAGCGVRSRNAITKWRAGHHWPYPAGEQVLEDVLKVPRGFFFRIGEGLAYEDAISRAAAEEPLTTLLRSMPPHTAPMPVTETEAHILFGTPLIPPDTAQVQKFQQMLEYLTALKTGITIVTLASALSFPLTMVTEWAEGRRSIPHAARALIAHMWDLRESFWTAPAEAVWLNYVGRRRRHETVEGEEGTLLMQASFPPEYMPVAIAEPEERRTFVSAIPTAASAVQNIKALLLDALKANEATQRVMQALLEAIAAPDDPSKKGDEE